MAITVKSFPVPGKAPTTFRQGGKVHYNINIFIDSDIPAELDNVRTVVYHLHPSFKDPNRTSVEATHFPIQLWTYAPFALQCEIIKKDGTVEVISGTATVPAPQYENAKVRLSPKIKM